MSDIGNYVQHAKYWDWGGIDRSDEHEYWLRYAERYGKNVLIPMCALGETGAYLAERGFSVTAFDITPEMIEEGKKRFGAIQNLRLLEGDVTDFRFDIPPTDFCFSMDFGHLLSMEDVKKALLCIHRHLREGGCLVVETTLPPAESSSYPEETFMPMQQIYPRLKVWKTSQGRVDAQTGRHYISQTFYAQDESGDVERFDHSFYLQSYPREAWLAAFAECGFSPVMEHTQRNVASWQSGDDFRIFEAVKATHP